MGVAINIIVLIYLDAQTFKLLLEGVCRSGRLISRHNDGSDVKSVATECIDQS